MTSIHDNSTMLIPTVEQQAVGATIKVERPSPEDVSTTTSQDDSDTDCSCCGNNNNDDGVGARISSDTATDDKVFLLKSSIKFSSLQDKLFLHPVDRRESRKVLPRPDMKEIQSRKTSAAPPAHLETYSTNDAIEETTPATTAVVDEEPQKTPLSRKVTFANIHIRSYHQTLGDNPSVSYGPPIQLDWSYEDQDDVLSLDSYEGSRVKRRSLPEMKLNYHYRMNMLHHFCGHDRAELKAAQRKADADKMKRSWNNYLLPLQMLEDGVESGLRKTKRLLLLNQSKAPLTTAY